jgi:alkaline phosphatase D
MLFTTTAALVLLGAGLAAPEEAPPLSRIAFGSCVKQDQPQPIWDAVIASRPQLFLMLGDNIYGDTDDMDVLRAKWRRLGEQPGFRALRKAVPILATWDDHDYGRNDAGVEYPKKKESQQIFLDFFQEPPDSPRRSQEGVYAATVIGPPGRRVQILLLDTRYHRSPLLPNGLTRVAGQPYPGPYAPNDDPEATLLGEEQWAWLARQLAVPAEVRLLCSSVQVVPDEHAWEKWGNFPRERQRLFDLIRETKAHGVICLSGDRHHAEISRSDDVLPYPLFEVTSSSLNAPSQPKTEPNRDRVGDLFTPVNFGTIEIDWEEPDPTVTLAIRRLDGKAVLSYRFPLSRLRFP